MLDVVGEVTDLDLVHAVTRPPISWADLRDGGLPYRIPGRQPTISYVNPFEGISLRLLGSPRVYRGRTHKPRGYPAVPSGRPAATHRRNRSLCARDPYGDGLGVRIWCTKSPSAVARVGHPPETTQEPDIPSRCAFSARTPREKAQLEWISPQIVRLREVGVRGSAESSVRPGCPARTQARAHHPHIEQKSLISGAQTVEFRPLVAAAAGCLACGAGRRRYLSVAKAASKAARACRRRGRG